jgi:hypothetical protein
MICGGSRKTKARTRDEHQILKLELLLTRAGTVNMVWWSVIYNKP